jgi:general secretion pathway protein L
MSVGLAMPRDVMAWWLRQMRALLPHRLLPNVGLADALIVGAEGPWLHFSQRRKQHEAFLGRYRSDEMGLRGAKAVIRPRRQRVILRLDPTALLERKVVLPLAAEHDLPHVLRYEMDRLTPFTADQVFWSASIEHRDRGAGRLQLSLTLVPKSLVQPALAALAAIGLGVMAIEGAARDGTVRIIDLVQTSSHGPRLPSLAWSAVAALALIAIATPFVKQSLARAAIEARISELQPRMAQVEALRHRIAAGAAGNDVIAAERARIGDALQVLATVTDLLPDDTVLADLSLRQGKLSITGRSNAAPQLIPAMADDPTLHNPSFAAPVTRTQDGKADTFVIRAELNP